MGKQLDCFFAKQVSAMVASFVQCQELLPDFATSDLKPLRIPLQVKKSKRCPACRHILIKPEQKSQSVRYKIKLVAANYLPAITVSLPHAVAAMELMKRSPALSKSVSSGVLHAAEDPAAPGLIPGKTYAFHLAFTNPLYDPIQVRLKKVQPLPMNSGDTDPEKARRVPFQVSLPTAAFPIAAFAEAWEYEDDEEDMFGLDDDDLEMDGHGMAAKDGRGKTRTVGVIERRANVTVISGEVLITKEARGNIRVGCCRLATASGGSRTHSSTCSSRIHTVRTTQSRPRKTRRALLRVRTRPTNPRS